MKNKILLPFLFFTVMLYSQKENTLFWEISGNGLAKKSYLYGTMHMSDKVSYHLSDSFFNNLMSADMVANESDPETWSELKNLTTPAQYNYPHKFYSNFYKIPIKKEAVKKIFINDNSYFNNLLSLGNESQADYQENSVLDMFIYHTGRKYNKKVLGLEIAKESLIPLLNLTPEDAIAKEENRAILFKFLKNRNPEEVMKQYYREKDIVMLDSLYKLIFSKKAQNALIINRNYIISKSIDSLAKKGSLFAAVGAAHLAGKEGIIEILIKKGYQVKPIFDGFSESGQKKKKAIEEYFPNPNFIVSKTKDGMIQMPLFKTVIEKDSHLGSPDFTNGGVINITRLPLNYFLKKENTTYNPKSLDSLFFENIPGNILEKKYFEGESYTGYDIKSSTKIGNSQHYRFYITPLEIVAISMTGSGNYVRQYENEVFSTIKIKNFSSNWEKVQPENGGFSVEVPAFKIGEGLGLEDDDVAIQAYDTAEKGYYFLTQKTLNDTSEILSTEEEQKQIHNEFYLQYDADSLDTNYNPETASFESNSKIGAKNVKLKSFIHGSKYYLLGTVNASEKNTLRFFNSFKKEPLFYDSNLKTFEDTLAKFKIQIPERGNEKTFLNIENKKEYSKNTFVSKNNYYNFRTLSGKTVDLEYYKYPKYYSQTSLDSIKKKFEKDLLNEYTYDDEDDYSEEGSFQSYDFMAKKGMTESTWTSLTADKKDAYEFISKTESYDKEKNIYTLEAVVSKPNSSQAIRNKIVHTGNSYYKLTALTEKNVKNEDEFIQNTFDSFTLLDNKTILAEDKLDVFINDAKSEKDTIRYSALTSARQLDLTKKDFEKVTDFLTAFQFKDTEIVTVQVLLEKIGAIGDDRVIPFLEKFYKKENTKTETQITVLKALTNQKSKASYRKIIELLEYDLPLSNDEYQISSLFSYFERDLENSKELYPKIVQFYSIKEYNQPVIAFCNQLFDHEKAPIKKLNSYKKILITNAKMEYKRLLSSKQSYTSEEEFSELTFDDIPTSGFINYLNLLSNFKEDKAINEIFEKANKLEIPTVSNEILRIKVVNNKLTDVEEKEALNNPAMRFLAVQLLLNKDPKQEFKTISDEEMALSALMNIRNLSAKDSLQFIKTSEFKKSNKDISSFFFKSETIEKATQLKQNVLYAVSFVKENGKLNFQAYDVTQREITEETPLENQIDALINSIAKELNIRASYEKDNNEIDSLYDFSGY